MLKRLIHQYVLATHNWRNHGHTQLADLYMSMGIRTMAISMVSVFLPFFLYELGFSIPEVIAYYLVFTAARIPINYVTAQIIGSVGPKHTIAMSTILNILYMGLLFSFETVGWPLYGVAVIHTTANSLFFSAYHTDFSKIKKSKHAGKELGHMSIVQRLGGVAGPLLGGLLAGLVDPRASVGVAAVLLVISLVPLFKTNEPVRTHQTITYKGLFAKIQPHSRNILALSAQNVGSIVPHIFWSFFIALTIFSENTYASLGLLVTASVFISLFISRQVGHYADKGYGAKLLRLGVGADILLGLSRLVINSAGPAVLHNLAREQTVPVRSIPITKGFYDESDQFPGQRIAYIITVENIIMFVRTLFLAVVLVLMSYVEPLDMLRYGSVAASIVGVLAITERYRALR